MASPKLPAINLVDSVIHVRIQRAQDGVPEALMPIQDVLAEFSHIWQGVMGDGKRFGWNTHLMQYGGTDTRPARPAEVRATR